MHVTSAALIWEMKYPEFYHLHYWVEICTSYRQSDGRICVLGYPVVTI